MIGEMFLGIVKIVIGIMRVFNNRIVVLIQTQYGCLVRRRNKYAIVVGEIGRPEYIIAISQSSAEKTSIMNLDDKIHDIITNPGRYTKEMILSI